MPMVLRGYLEVRIDYAAVRDLHKSFYHEMRAEYILPAAAAQWGIFTGALRIDINYAESSRSSPYYIPFSARLRLTY